MKTTTGSPKPRHRGRRVDQAGREQGERAQDSEHTDRQAVPDEEGDGRAQHDQAQRRIAHGASGVGRRRGWATARTRRCGHVRPTVTAAGAPRRVHPWITRRVTTSPPTNCGGNGLYIGAFGWLEDLRPAAPLQQADLTSTPPTLPSARSPQELGALVRNSARHGSLDPITATLVGRSLRFGTRTADELLTPRTRR